MDAMTLELKAQTKYTQEEVERFTQRVLDSLSILELQHYEHAFTRPLVTTIVTHILNAVPAGGRLLVLGASPFLIHCLVEQGFRVDAPPLNGQVLPAGLNAQTKGPLTSEDLLAPTPPFAQGAYDAVVLALVLEALPGDPIPFLYRLRRLLPPEGIIILATTNFGKLGTRWRALLGRDFQPSALHGPQAPPGDWPKTSLYRLYTPDEVALLTRAAGYRILTTSYTMGQGATFPLEPVSLPRWAARHLKHAVNSLWPRWRTYLVATLQALPHFDLPGYPDVPDFIRVPVSPGEDGAPYWRPFVSVVLPTHNRSAMLRDCLENGLFLQNYPRDRWEIVLINDGSVDDTEEVVQELIPKSPVPVRYFKLEGRGATAARNFGMQQARGEIVAHIDDDGRAVPGWLEAGVNHFKPGVALVAGPIVLAPEEKPSFFCYVPQMPDDRGLFPTANLFMRRDLALAEGGFDESFGKNVLGRPAPGWDADLAYRILRKGYTYVFTPEALTYSHAFHLSWWEWVKEIQRWRFQAGIIQRIPETRRGLAPIGGIVAEGRARLYWLLSLSGILLAPWMGAWTLLLGLPWFIRKSYHHRSDLLNIKRFPMGAAKVTLMWLWHLGAFLYLMYGVVRARRLLI